MGKFKLSCIKNAYFYSMTMNSSCVPRLCLRPVESMKVSLPPRLPS